MIEKYVVARREVNSIPLRPPFSPPHEFLRPFTLGNGMSCRCESHPADVDIEGILAGRISYPLTNCLLTSPKGCGEAVARNTASRYSGEHFDDVSGSASLLSISRSLANFTNYLCRRVTPL
jgi:hypothetical protein